MKPLADGNLAAKKQPTQRQPGVSADGAQAMTSRHRVLAAVNRQPVDRAPTRFNCDPGPVGQRIARDLGLTVEGDWFETLQQRLGIDMRILDLEVTNGDYSGDKDNLVDAETAADVDRCWPHKWQAKHRTLVHAIDRVRAWDASGVVPAVQVRLAGLLGPLRYMRGPTLACMDFADENVVFHHVFDRMEEYCGQAIDLAFDTLGQRLDIISLADELGMQSGLMYSPASLRQHVFPRFARLFAQVHARGGKVFYHSCGAIEPLIGDLIDIGVDILNPIQPNLPGMDPENLARKFGGRACFCGGIDMQQLLPNGTPVEVRAEVTRYVKCLGSGYIIDSANILHPDIPTANIRAIFDAPRT